MEQMTEFIYKSVHKERISCPVCDSSNSRLLLDIDRYDMGVHSEMCNNCGLIYINPRPTELEMSIFYKHHYRKFYESIEIPTEDYIKKGPFLDRAKFVIQSLKPYLVKATTFLDMGCAEGTLIKFIEKNYKDIKASGVEPSLGFGNFAKESIKGEIFIGDYQNFLKEKSDSKFDVIATTHVLEHILDPNHYLQALKSLMHSESVLFIEVPNIMNNKSKGLGNIHIGHVLSFDPITLKLLLEKNGFEVLNEFTEGLPALTPAMAVICKIDKKVEKIKLPTKKELNVKANLFIENITRTKQKKVKKSIISRIIKKIFK